LPGGPGGANLLSTTAPDCPLKKQTARMRAAAGIPKRLYLFLEREIMTRKFYLGMAALVTLAAFTAARAEEVDVASLDEYYAEAGSSNVEQVSTMNVSTRFASMEAELESLRAQVQQVSFGGGGDKGCYDCGATGCNCYCDIGCGGVYAGVELALLKPHFDTGIENDIEADGFVDPNNASFDYEATPRFYAGYRNCDGLGIRARYWTFDQAVTLENPDGPGNFFINGIDATSVDLEVTQLVCWGPLQMNFAGGVRYGKFEHNGAEIDDEDIDIFHNDFEGWGPTLAMEGRRPIGCSGLALVGNVRSSLLFGESKTAEVNDGDVDNPLANADLDVYEDDMSLGLESQIGVEYSRCLGNGVFKVRALLEGQYWGAVSQVEVADNPGDDNEEDQQNGVGFVGATFGVEYSR